VATCRNPAVPANLLYGSILPNVIISNFDAMKNEFRGFRQIFEIYQAIPNASLEKMNGLIRVAVNICTWVYIFVGTFGYIAFFQKPFTGNILLSFKPSITSDVIKLGFVLSLAFSFPLVIFPCRASLNSLLYKGVPLRDNSITFFFYTLFSALLHRPPRRSPSELHSRRKIQNVDSGHSFRLSDYCAHDSHHRASFGTGWFNHRSHDLCSFPCDLLYLHFAQEYQRKNSSPGGSNETQRTLF
jgi:hypothetical protein